MKYLSFVTSLSLFVLSLTCTQANPINITRTDSGISMTFNLKDDTYTDGETIIANISIKNVSKESMYLLKPDIWRAISIDIKAEDGNPMPVHDEISVTTIKNEEYVEVAVREQLNSSFDVLSEYTELLKPGRYIVNITYNSGYIGRQYPNVSLTSGSIIISVLNPQKDEWKTLKHARIDIAWGDRKEKALAIQELEQLRNNTSDSRLKSNLSYYIATGMEKLGKKVEAESEYRNIVNNPDTNIFVDKSSYALANILKSRNSIPEAIKILEKLSISVNRNRYIDRLKALVSGNRTEN